MKHKESIDWGEVRENCPEGYIVNGGETIDMLGKTELWRIFENHPEPELTRLPQDMVDTPFGSCAKRIPTEWGRCMYNNVV